MTLDVTTIAITIFGTFAGSLLTFLATRKQSDDKKEIEFREQTLKLAQDLQLNLVSEVEKLKKENKELKDRILELERFRHDTK